MTQRFRNRYRVPSARLQTWDYGRPGAYFITICTHQRRRFFGRVERGAMVLSPIGQVAHDFWAAIPDHHPHVRRDAFVVMPDHVHGIVVIASSDGRRDPDGGRSPDARWSPDDGRSPVETRNFASLPNPGGEPISPGGDADDGPICPTDRRMDDGPISPDGCGSRRYEKPWRTNRFGPLPPKSVPAIIQSYKAAVTRWCRKNGYDAFAWQPRYHDSIIRDMDGVQRVRRYIADNPRKWRETGQGQSNL